MKQTVRISSIRDIGRAAEEFLEKMSGQRILAFYGSMGAGKTTFTVALCKALGVTDNVCSPTFTIVNEYAAKSGELIYHFDFYRIRNNAEAMDIGVEDYFYSGRMCIIEWPENIESLLPEDAVRIHIDVEQDGSRTISWEER